MLQLPISYIRLIVGTGCNLQCSFCYKEGLDSNQSGKMSFEDALLIINTFSKLGVQKIRFTGGEPLIWEPLWQVLSEIKSNQLFSRVAITTNGVDLERYAAHLYDLGVTDVSASLPSISAEKYARITGEDRLQDVLASIQAIAQYPFRRKVINFVYTRDSTEAEFFEMLDSVAPSGVILRVIDVVLDEQARVPLDSLEAAIMRKNKNAHKVKFNITQYRFSNGAIVEIDRNPCNLALDGDRNSCVSCARDYPLRITPGGELKPCILRNDNLININDVIKDGASLDEISELVHRSITIRGPESSGWTFKKEELWQGSG